MTMENAGLIVRERNSFSNKDVKADVGLTIQLVESYARLNIFQLRM